MRDQVNQYSDKLWELLAAFTAKGYRFASFEEDERSSSAPLLYLRHDIDFDCDLAEALAEQEYQRGILSTYYFLIRSDAYNFFSAKNTARVRRIQSFGHKVSLHFDPTLYSDPVAGLKKELNAFESWLGLRPKRISIHRPKPEFIAEPDSSLGTQHLYQRQFIKDMAYFADSRGQFRFGHPLDSAAFSRQQPINLLIHPIWWIEHAEGLLEQLAWLRSKHTRDFDLLLQENCIPYKESVEGLKRQ